MSKSSFSNSGNKGHLFLENRNDVLLKIMAFTGSSVYCSNIYERLLDERNVLVIALNYKYKLGRKIESPCPWLKVDLNMKQKYTSISAWKAFGPSMFGFWDMCMIEKCNKCLSRNVGSLTYQYRWKIRIRLFFLCVLCEKMSSNTWLHHT